VKFVSWNVNGLRACLLKGFSDFFHTCKADFFSIQETKMQPGQAELTLNGYQEFWNSATKKGYSGTAVFAKKSPLHCTQGMGMLEHDQEGRIITLEYEEFFLVNVYTPNSQRGLLRLDYRMLWEDAFADYLQALDVRKPVIICGDLNVAHNEIDIKNPKTNISNAGFTPQEREKMTRLLSLGFVDSFRHLHPNAKDKYTWWSYMANARERNVGWRIDYFLVSKRLETQIIRADIEASVLGSDHCPVVLELKP